MLDKKIDYTGSLHSLQLPRLHTFATRKTDKSPPVAFVGRNDLIDTITMQVADKHTKNLPENAFFIQGAPGSGKTSLLRHLEDAYLGKGTGILPVYVEGWEVNTPLAFAGKAINVSDEDAIEAMAESKTRGHQSEARNLNALGHKETWETHRASVTDQINAGTSLWDVLGSVLKNRRDEVLLFLIDEAQGITGIDAADNNTIAMALNSGDTGRLKTACVFAGLSDTQAVLDRVGISRTARPFVGLEALTLEESELSVAGFLEEYKLNPLFSEDSLRAIKSSLATASEGWPRHLHHYLQGLAIEVTEDHRKGDALDSLDLNKVFDHGHEKRLDYYDDRLLSIAKPFEDALLEHVRGTTPDQPINEDQFIARVAGRRSEDWAESQLERAVHAGVLEQHRSRRGEYRFPIPSFHTYMSCGRNRDIALSKLRQMTDAKVKSLFPSA